VLPAILFAALSLAPVLVAQEQPTPASEQSFAALARQLSAELQKQCVRRVFILDFEDPEGKVTPFGAWLAEQLASVPGNPWAPIEIEDDRSAIAALLKLSGESGEPGGVTGDKAIAIGFALRATPVTGSYSAGDNGIGVKLVAFTACGAAQVIGKIAMTDEMKSHLTVPLDSLVPSDGIFEPGRGGISEPRCEYCPNPTYTNEATEQRTEGTVNLLIVVNAEGRATTVSIVKKLGNGLDEAAAEVIRTWRFKPAVNVDGKPVATRVPVEITFRTY
jgi:TonB family protein